MPINHTKVSAAADDADTSLVRPVDWNATHTLTGTGGLSSGTSFPVSPTTDDVFYRTDRRLLYFWDGTRWLTTNLYREHLSLGTASQTVAFTVGRLAPWYTTYDLWMETFHGITNAAATNNGSNYWLFTLRKYQSNFSTNTSLGTIDTSADTAATGTLHTTNVNALLVPATYILVQVEATKIASPGALTGYSFALTYRLVG